MTADVTLSIPLDGPTLSAGSGTTFYADRILCPWLIVDYWVPAGPGVLTLSVWQPTKCFTSVQMLMYVRPPFATEFSLEDGAGSGPSWTCSYAPADGHSPSLTPGMWGARRWRVLVRAWFHNPLSRGKVPAPVFTSGHAESY